MFALFLTDQARGVDGFPFEEQDKPVGWAWWAPWEGGGNLFLYGKQAYALSPLRERIHPAGRKCVRMCVCVF